jgi:hypothetical protein
MFCPGLYIPWGAGLRQEIWIVRAQNIKRLPGTLRRRDVLEMALLFIQLSSDNI